ncbi:MAG TPA: FAD-dependent oxidoreductase [Longimicrobiales bacterium]
MSVNALVIGAGIVGAAVADALSMAGVRVQVLDAGFPGCGTTAAGMGHIVVMDDSRAQLALTAYSRGLFDEMAGELPPACELDRCGTLWIAEDEEQLESARVKASRLQAGGVAAELIDAATLRDAEPALRTGLAGAVHVPQDSVVYPPALCRFLLERAVSRGARVLHDTRVLRIEAHTVVTGAGRMDAEVIVNAAGTAAADLIPGLPVLPRKGHLVITDRYPDFCRHQLVELGYMRSAHALAGSSVAFNVQPRTTGQLLIGSSREMAGHDPAVNRHIVSRMLQRAAQFLPGIVALNALRVWTGFRPATPDKLPLIGRWDPLPGVWIAAGHEGLGITTALGTARLLADMLLGRTTSIDAAAFSPVRTLASAAP